MYWWIAVPTLAMLVMILGIWYIIVNIREILRDSTEQPRILKITLKHSNSITEIFPRQKR